MAVRGTRGGYRGYYFITNLLVCLLLRVILSQHELTLAQIVLLKLLLMQEKRDYFL